MSIGIEQLVSVVMPTYHRPESLPAAVASVLGQVLPPGTALEIVISLSDPDSASDIAAAEALTDDPRVRITRATRPGPAAARNAGLSLARGDVVALIDDDCEAQPDWIAEGLKAISVGDLVQGRTVRADTVSPYDHTVQVDPPSWLWETCNLFVRRELLDRVGGFDEDWNPTGQVGGHFGEDTIWGWKLVRSGARPVFTTKAVVRHGADRRDFRGWLTYIAKVRYFPLILQEAPEARNFLYRKYFLSKRHVPLMATLVMLGAAGVAHQAGNRRWRRLALAGAGVSYNYGYLRSVLPDLVKFRAPRDIAELAALAYGSVRYRRIVL